MAGLMPKADASRVATETIVRDLEEAARQPSSKPGGVRVPRGLLSKAAERITELEGRAEEK